MIIWHTFTAIGSAILNGLILLSWTVNTKLLDLFPRRAKRVFPKVFENNMKNIQMLQL